MEREYTNMVNKSIADFMGYPGNKNSHYYYAMKHCYDNDLMKYHEDERWLNPVIDKLKNIGCLFTYGDNWVACQMVGSYSDTAIRYEGVTNYEALYHAAGDTCEFINRMTNGLYNHIAYN